MTTQYTSGRSSSGTLVAVLFSLLLGAAALALFIRHATSGVLGRVATAITGRTSTFDTSVPAVVQRIQRLNRLETVVYSIDTVVEGARSSPVLPDLLAGDRLLLVVHAKRAQEAGQPHHLGAALTQAQQQVPVEREA